MTTTRSRLTGLTAALALLFAAACGGDDGGSDADATSTTAAEDGGALGDGTGDTTATTEAAEPEETEVDLAGTAHHAGFAYTLTRATISADDVFYDLTIEFDVENTGLDSRTPYPESPTLELADGTGLTGSYETSEVPGGGSGSGTMTFRLDQDQAADLDLAETTLVFGQGTENQVELVLDGSDQAVLVPIELDPIAEIVSSNITYTFHTATLRWDDPVRYVQSADGNAFLVLDVTIANGDTNQSCIDNSFVITAPDGVEESTDSVSVGCISGGETERNVQVVIEIQAIESGTYTLTVDSFPTVDAKVDPQTVDIEIDLDAEPDSGDDAEAEDETDGDGEGDAEDPEDDSPTTTEG